VRAFIEWDVTDPVLPLDAPALSNLLQHHFWGSADADPVPADVCRRFVGVHGSGDGRAVAKLVIHASRGGRLLTAMIQQVLLAHDAVNR